MPGRDSEAGCCLACGRPLAATLGDLFMLRHVSLMCAHCGTSNHLSLAASVAARAVGAVAGILTCLGLVALRVPDPLPLIAGTSVFLLLPVAVLSRYALRTPGALRTHDCQK